MEKKIYIKKIYYFDDIMRVRDVNFTDFLLNKKSYNTCKNILIYNIS